VWVRGSLVAIVDFPPGKAGNRFVEVFQIASVVPDGVTVRDAKRISEISLIAGTISPGKSAVN
jgi:hypothetical protein